MVNSKLMADCPKHLGLGPGQSTDLNFPKQVGETTKGGCCVHTKKPFIVKKK